METRIVREEMENKGKFIIYAGDEEAGEMTYSKAGEKLIIIDHTEVEKAFEGRGLAGQLVEAGVKWIRDSEKKLVPLCPYAKAKIDRTPEWQDVLDS